MISRVTRTLVILAVVATAGACAMMCPRRNGPLDRFPVATTTPSTAPATQASGAALTVAIKDLRNRKGTVIFGIFRSADGFPNIESKSVYWEVKDADTPSLSFTAHLPPGRYAASVLHDENRSGEMNRGIAGIPLEGYGVTNNPKPLLRAATFDEASFTLPAEGKEMTISLQYF